MFDSLIINGAALLPGVNTVPVARVAAGVDEAQELRIIAAESIGWLPLGDDAYLHAADRSGMDTTVISIIGLPQDAQEGFPTLLLV